MTSLVSVQYHTFGCISCFGKIYKICLVTGIMYTFPVYMDLLVSLIREWLGLGNGDTN